MVEPGKDVLPPVVWSLATISKLSLTLSTGCPHSCPVQIPPRCPWVRDSCAFTLQSLSNSVSKESSLILSELWKATFFKKIGKVLMTLLISPFRQGGERTTEKVKSWFGKVENCNSSATSLSPLPETKERVWSIPTRSRVKCKEAGPSD